MANRADLSTRVTAVLDVRQQRGRAGTRVVTIGAAVAALLVLVISPLRVVTASAVAPRGAMADSSAQGALSPKFEVVSIKPCLPADPSIPASGRGGANANHISVTPGNAFWSCTTLSEIIDQAYGGGSFPNNSLQNSIRVPPFARPDAPKRVRGGPAWVTEDRFTIEIKMTGDQTGLSGSAHHNTVLTAMTPALRAMLEDRFQLKLRVATEEQPMYALVVAKEGLKITQTAPQKCWERPPTATRDNPGTAPPGFEGTPACGYDAMSTRGTVEFSHINLKDLAYWLAERMDRYVLDKTNVEGRFSFRLSYQPDNNTPGDIQDRQRSSDAFASLLAANGRPPQPERPPVVQVGPTIFKGLEALGLKLDKTTGPAEYLQIDSAQRPRPNSPASAEAAAGRPEADALPPARARGVGR
jgi:uncharacterized protein (TIGR03435 family)